MTGDGRAFGEFLRAHRARAGLTQEALAERAGLSVRGLSDLERGLKARPYFETVRLLAEALGLSAEERAALLTAARPPAPPGPSGEAAPALRLRLPVPPTPLVGRAAERAHVAALLRGAARLATLTGPGGVGKTRLAIAVAEELAPDFGDGAAFVDLAPLADPALVPSAVAAALGIRETGGRPLTEALADHLRDQHLLLVLDNFEHLLAAAPTVAGLLAAAPRLRVLATSRAPLRLRAEHELPVPPLPTPDPRRPERPGRLTEYDAVRLFVERAAAVKPGFVLADENAPAVAELCHRLDGLPLAIELAAARLKVLPPPALLQRLERRLPLLTGGARDLPARQRTLRDAIAWSHDLLTPDEQAVFRCLSVFAGGCTLGAAEAVCGRDGELDVFAGLAALVDSSLLQQPDGAAGEPRFTMLETIREFAFEQLEEMEETDAAVRSHVAWCLALAEAAEPELAGPQQDAWLDRLEAEHDNLRAALTRTATGEAALNLRLAGHLARFWEIRSHYSDGREYLERALVAHPEASVETQARALRGAGALAYRQGEFARATAMLHEGLALSREVGDRRGVADALNSLGNVAFEQGDYPRAAALHDEALALRRALGDAQGVANSLNNLGLVAVEQGDYDRAAGLHEEALTLRRALGDKQGVAASLGNLGNLAYEQGDHDQAAARFAGALELARALGDKRGEASALDNLGLVALERGDLDRAAALHTRALELDQELGDKRGAAISLKNLGSVEYEQGNHGRAAARFAQALARFRELGDQWGIVVSLEAMAALAATLGDAARATRLFATAASLRDTIGAPLPPAERATVERSVAALRTCLGEAAFAAGWEAGRALSLEEAVAEALALAEELGAVRNDTGGDS